MPCDWLGRIEPVEIPVKLVFHLLDPVKFDLSLRDFGIYMSEKVAVPLSAATTR